VTPDAYMTAQECLSVASLALASWFCIRARHLEAREQVARTEVRRLKHWAGEWRAVAEKIGDDADRLQAELDKARALPSKRASHARQCQLTQQRARKLETTQRLERGE
jgi:hypothetical protein